MEFHEEVPTNSIVWKCMCVCTCVCIDKMDYLLYQSMLSLRSLATGSKASQNTPQDRVLHKAK